MSAAALAELGRQLLVDAGPAADVLEILGEDIENSHRPVVIRKARQGYQAYRQMLHYYAVKNLLDYLDTHPSATCDSLSTELSGPRERNWVNLGGQLMPAGDVDQLRADIRATKLDSWFAIHQRYDALWHAYPAAQQRHAFATLLALLGVPRLDEPTLQAALDEAIRIQDYVCDQVYRSRQKDYEGAFRRVTFRNDKEMEAVLGRAEDNSFVKQVRDETAKFRGRTQAARQRLGPQSGEST